MLVIAKSLQTQHKELCPTLCHPMDCSPSGSSVHGILQARILKWAAIPFSRGSSQSMDQTHVSYIYLCLISVLARRLFTTRATWEANTLVISCPKLDNVVLQSAVWLSLGELVRNTLRFSSCLWYQNLHFNKISRDWIHLNLRYTDLGTISSFFKWKNRNQDYKGDFLPPALIGMGGREWIRTKRFLSLLVVPASLTTSQPGSLAFGCEI